MAHHYAARFGPRQAFTRQALQQARCPPHQAADTESVRDDSRHDADADDLPFESGDCEAERKPRDRSAGAQRYDDAVRRRQDASYDLRCELQSGVHLA